MKTGNFQSCNDHFRKSFSRLFWTRWLRRLPMTRTQPATCQRTCGGRTCFDFLIVFFWGGGPFFFSFLLFFRRELFCFLIFFSDDLFYLFFKGGPFFLLLGTTFFSIWYIWLFREDLVGIKKHKKEHDKEHKHEVKRRRIGSRRRISRRPREDHNSHQLSQARLI